MSDLFTPGGHERLLPPPRSSPRLPGDVGCTFYPFTVNDVVMSVLPLLPEPQRLHKNSIWRYFEKKLYGVHVGIPIKSYELSYGVKKNNK